jgi:type II secretory pathway component GspD/PulD (secretin)
VASSGSGFVISEDSFVVGKLKIIADERTNRIHVITRQENLLFIRSLISQLDANVDFGQPVRRPLRFVRAGEVLDVLVQALTEPGQEADAGQGGQPGQGQRPGSNQPPAGAGGSTDGGGLNVSEGLNTEPVDTTPEAVTIGNTRLIADRRSNAIIILGNREAKEKVFRVLDELDVRAPQVMFNVVIGELSLDKGESWGIDFLLRLFGGNLNIGSANSQVEADPDATDPDDPSDVITNLDDLANVVGNLNGLTAFFSVGRTLEGFVRALEATDRFKVISRPTVFTENNKKAIIASGEEVAVPVSSTTSFTGGGEGAVPVTNSNIEFKQIILQLEVVPLINAEREINLDVLQKIDSISGSSVIDGNSIPTIATRYIRTHVTVPDGTTVFLGGLIIDDRRRQSRGIPFLARIPVLGYLFGGFDKDQRRRELVIMITPHVATNTEEIHHNNRLIDRDYIMEQNLEQQIVPAEKEKPPPRLIPLDSPYPVPALERIRHGDAEPEDYGWRYATPAAPPPPPSEDADEPTPPRQGTKQRVVRAPSGPKARPSSRQRPLRGRPLFPCPYQAQIPTCSIP